jgi:hypothetical protein
VKPILVFRGEALPYILGVLAILALLVVGVVVGGQAPVAHALDPGTPDPQYNSFFTRCEFDLTRMRRQVDPIVSPGVNPSAHMHDFYGFIAPTENTSAHSTLPNPNNFDPGYSQGSSTCRLYGDWPSYWFPTAYFNGVITPNVTDPGVRTVKTSWLLTTYRSPVGQTVLAPPYGMTYVAGRSSAQTLGEESENLHWTCGQIEGGSRRPIDCTRGGVVTAVLEFPRCWDRTNGWLNDGWNGLFDRTETSVQSITFDSHAGIAPSHFAYGDPCPTGFTAISQLVTRQHFTDPRTRGPLVDPFGDDGRIALSFSSGPYWTYHGDFLNLWDLLLAQDTRVCNNFETFPGSDKIDCLNGLQP